MHSHFLNVSVTWIVYYYYFCFQDLDPNSAFVAIAASKNKKMAAASVLKNKSLKKEKIKDNRLIMRGVDKHGEDVRINLLCVKY